MFEANKLTRDHYRTVKRARENGRRKLRAMEKWSDKFSGLTLGINKINK